MKCKTDKISNIKNLNLWGNELVDVSIVRDMPNIEICSLSLNKIVSLKDFSTCKKLTELYLRKNLITELTEVKYLLQCP
jgi:Leucine-rich repeat (LRR) protein